MKVSSLETKYFQKTNRNGMGVQMWGKNGESRVLTCRGKV
jgi:hypothetical protein